MLAGVWHKLAVQPAYWTDDLSTKIINAQIFIFKRAELPLYALNSIATCMLEFCVAPFPKTCHCTDLPT